MKIDESPIGLWLWLVLIVSVNAEWIAMDLWLHAHGHEFLTTECREALHSDWWPVPVILTVVTFAAVIIHFYVFNRP